MLTGLFGLSFRRPPTPAKSRHAREACFGAGQVVCPQRPTWGKVVDAQTQEPVGETPWTTDAGDSGASRKPILKLDGYLDAEDHAPRWSGRKRRAVPTTCSRASATHQAATQSWEHKNKLAAPQIREKCERSALQSSQVLVTAALACFLLLSGSAQAQTAGPTKAESEFDQQLQMAAAHYEQGRYQDSILALQNAYELQPLPRLLCNIGQAYRKLGNHRAAVCAI